MVKHRSPKPQLGVRVSLPLLYIDRLDLYPVCFFISAKGLFVKITNVTKILRNIFTNHTLYDSIHKCNRNVTFMKY